MLSYVADYVTGGPWPREDSSDFYNASVGNGDEGYVFLGNMLGGPFLRNLMSDFHEGWSHSGLSSPFSTARIRGWGVCRHKSLVMHFLIGVFGIEGTLTASQMLPPVDVFSIDESDSLDLPFLTSGNQESRGTSCECAS